MNSKIMATMASLMMVVVAFAGVSALIDSSDAATSNDGIVDVYFKGPTGDLASTTVTAYDLYQAVTVADSTLGFTAESNDSSWNQLEGEAPYQYYNPDQNYGTLSGITIGDSTISISAFTVYVYNTAVNSTAYSWNVANPAIGWYHPYSDYSAFYTSGTTNYSMASAAIAIIYVTETTTESVLDNTTPKTPVTVTDDDSFKYTFTIKSNHALSFGNVNVKIEEDGIIDDGVLNTSNIRSGMTIVGWGSNAYEALKNALGSTNVEGQSEYALLIVTDTSSYYKYYSWLGPVLGADTDTTVNADGSYTYKYWSSYVGDQYCEYTFGYYSSIAGAPNSGNSFTLHYV